MSMFATIASETDAVEFNVDEWHVGDRIEVLGFVTGPQGVLLVVWRDDEGYIHDLPAWTVRMEPRTAAVDA